MEIVSILTGRWVEILAAVYLIGMMLYGHYRGFIRMSVSAAALVITLISVHAATPYVTDWLKNDTPLYGAISGGIEHAIGLDEDGRAKERIAIEGLELPEQIKRLLIENNNSDVYRQMGVELFHDYVTGYLTDMIVRILVFIILFLGIFILLHVIVVWLDLIAKLPILSGLNQIAGAVLGAAEALVFIWIACLVFTALSGTALGRGVLAQVEASVWLSWLYDHNMLTLMIFGILQSVL